MGRIDYLDALKRAMTGLAPETQAKTLAYYEQRFVDGGLAGRSEADVVAELDDPKKIAMTLRASVHMTTFEQKKSPANFLRMAFAAIGLLIFNLMMLVPAVVYAALLAALYAFGLALYLYGVVITASALSGTTEIKLDAPFQHVVTSSTTADGRQTHQVIEHQAKVTIRGGTIEFFSEPTPGASVTEKADQDGDGRRAMRSMRRAEEVARVGIIISSELDDASRTTQSLFGFSMVLLGILLLLLSLVVSNYTIRAIRRYIDMNFSLLKGS